MTKYILNSGGKNSEKFKLYLEEATKGLKKPKILICLFAQKREDWEEKYITIAEDIKRYNDDIKVELAFPDSFEEQVRNNDVIYINGGDDHLVQFWLKQFDLPKIWEGKVVATASASSHALAKHFWTCDWRQCFDGLGILPIKFIAHYNSGWGSDDPRGPIDWEKAYHELENYGDKNLPIYAPEEGDFYVFNI